MSARASEAVSAGPAVSMLRQTLAQLTAEDVRYCLRNGADALGLEPGGDVDVLILPTARTRARRTLAASGWHRVAAPGHWAHDFWLNRDEHGQWLKIDLLWRVRYGAEQEPTEPWLDRRVPVDGVWVASAQDAERHRQLRAAGVRERPGLVERAARRLPARPWRAGPVVAVLGPDGAGKGTLIERLREDIPVAVSTCYLGVGSSAVGVRHSQQRPTVPRRRDADQQPAVRLRELGFLTRKWLRTLPPLTRAYGAAWRGHIVLLDRHPLDALAVRPTRTRWGGRFERLLCVRLTPHPDAVLVLDAPGEVLFARKLEHSPELLERWRHGYRTLPGRGVRLLDATTPPEEVAAQARALVWLELRRRRRWPG